MKLWELKDEYNFIKEMIDDPDADEESFLEALKTVEGDIENKFDQLIKICKELEYEEAALDAEIKLMKSKKDKKTKRREGIKAYQLAMMQEMGIKTVPNKIFNINLRQNNPSVKVINEKLIPAEWWRVPEPKPAELDKVKILKALKEGIEIEGAEIQRTIRLDIK